MAAPPTTEASEIRRRGRQRLIGAIALVAILVVFVPMVLDSGPRQPRNEPDLSIPSRTDAPPLPAPPKAAPAKAADAKPAPAEAAKPAEATKAVESPKVATVESAPAKPLDAKVLESKPPAPPKAAPAASAAPAPDKGARPAASGAPSPPPRLEGFAVQVGAFRDEAKLDQARQKVFAAKIPHYTERLEAQGGPLTRLRAGPFPTREAAESALATLKRSAVDGKVVPLP